MWRHEDLSDLINPDSVIGLTSTVPVEIVLAAGLKPVDLNNIFITSPSADKLVNQAESAGFAHNICSWIKGIYATTLNRKITRVIAVTGGDCSNTIALGEILARRGVEVIHFDYPLDRSRGFLLSQMEKLMHTLNVSWPDVEKARSRLSSVREKLKELDRLTYEENVVTGLENHLFLVNSSDFNSDVDAYELKLDRFLEEAVSREPRAEKIRIGFLGVPPIFNGFYELIESLGARVVFNETQRQFSMPFENRQLVDQYLAYTYPYDILGRIDDIKRAAEERRLDGLIHYTQTFCFRQLYDIILRESLQTPILTLEGDRPGPLDSRTALRIETFVQILMDRKEGS